MVEEQRATDEAGTGSGGRSGCFWLIAGMMGCGALLLVLVAGLIVFGVTTVSGVVSGVGSFVGLPIGTPPPPIAEIAPSRTIVQGIQPLGQLVSVSAQLAKADVRVGIRQGSLNECGFSANHVGQGTIEAGIDLTGVTESDLRFDEANNRYILTVPSPQITSCRIDYIRQYDRSTTICAVDWDEARLLAQYITLTEFRDDAIESGILRRAEQETRIVLGNFVELVTGRPVEIIFRPATESTIPASCSPNPPAGWSLNPQSNQWQRGR